MEEIYEKIMREGYGLQLRHGTRTRTGLVCRTDRGLCELKKPRGSTDSLRLAFDVKKRLRENGFANISRCYPTLEGEPFYRQDGTLYILEDVLPQGTLAEDSAQTFLQGAETLGEMHAAAKGLASEAANGGASWRRCAAGTTNGAAMTRLIYCYYNIMSHTWNGRQRQRSCCAGAAMRRR